MREKGFTLLEVLLAITVLGVVVAMLSLSLSGTLKVIEATESQEEMYHQVQTTLRRITEDLAAAVLIKEVPFTGKKNEMDSQRIDSLAFASLSHLVLNPEKQNPGVAIIRYQLQADSEDARRLRLLRSDTLLLPGVDYSRPGTEDPSFLLADNLRSLRFTYYNQHGQEFDTWGGGKEVPGQQEAQPLPAAVYCTMEIWLDPKKETAQTFSTGVLIPAGLVVAEGKGEN